MNEKKIYAGTSGWAYVSWKPEFYPAKLAAARFLSYYATRLNSVEVNYTFRTIPTEPFLMKWIEATPPEFKFAVKAHQSITHFKRLRDAAGITTEFVNSLAPLRKAKKLGPVLFQLRESFKCDVPLLKDFLKGLPRGVRAAFEFRNESWFCDEVYDLLRRSNVALCQAESDDLVTPEVETADFSYLRMRKSSYSAKARRELASKIAQLDQPEGAYVYFKHEEAPEGAFYAEELLAETK